MTAIRNFMVNYYQTAHTWFKEIPLHVRGWVMTNREHWSMGPMLGLSVPASIFMGNPKISTIISVGTILGFAVGAAKYASKNWNKVKQFGLPTALTVLAVILILLHGVTNWISAFRWFPIYTSLTLLASVNVAPSVTKTLATLGAGFSAIAEMGRRSMIEGDREIDLEQTIGLLQEMVGRPNAGHQRSDDFGFQIGHMDHLLRAEDPELGADNPDSVELESGSVSTRSDVRDLLRVFNQMPSPVLQDVALAPIGSIPEQSVSFPQLPQDHLVEMPFPKSIQNPITEDSSLSHMLSE